MEKKKKKYIFKKYFNNDRLSLHLKGFRWEVGLVRGFAPKEPEGLGGEIISQGCT